MMQRAPIRRRLLYPLAVLVLVAAPHAYGVLPSEKLPNPALEARASALSKVLRCVVCQNQSIDDSGAPLAADLRVLLRERIAAGDSDEQAVAYLVERYGNFVLLKPPFNPATWLLWFGPFAVLLIGGTAIVAQIRKNPARGPLLPSDDEDNAYLADRL